MAKVKEKFVFIFFVFKYLNICVIVCSESDHLNKKNNELLTVASKHFDHVTFYAADEESGSICH